MAQVKQSARARELANLYLPYLFDEWNAVPGVAAEWGEWDADEQLDFVIEWPIREDRLQQLQRWAAEGQLTPAQCTRYQNLLALVAKHRPTLERLLAE